MTAAARVDRAGARVLPDPPGGSMTKHQGAAPHVRPLAADQVPAALRILGEKTGFLLWVAAPNLERVLFTSPAYERIWGQSRDSIYANPMSFADAIHPDDRERILRDFNEPMNGEVFRVVRPDDTMSWVRGWRFPLHDERGTVRQLVGIIEDITEQITALDDLAHRNRTLVALHEITGATLGRQPFASLVHEIAAHVAAAVGFPIVVTERYDDADGTVVLEAAAGLDARAGAPPEPTNDSLAPVVAHRGEPLVLPERGRHAAPATLYGSRVGTVVAAPQMDGGRPVGALTIAHPDVVPVQPTLVAFVATLANHLAAVLERRRTEDALRASEQLFQDVASHVHHAITLIDVRTGVPTYVSPGWERIFARDPALLANGVRAVLEWIHPDDRRRLGELLELTDPPPTLPPGTDGPFEFRILRPDGSVRWLRALGKHIRNARGEATHVLGFAEDVTVEKQRLSELEDAVARATARVRELERHQAELDRMAMAGRMAARIAHEINNPLASIKNAFFLLRDALVTTPERREWTDRIDREIDRIARIVRQMYELYRPEAGRGRAEVPRTLAAAVDVFASAARERGVRITTDLPVARHVVSVADSLLRELVSGVLQNAIEASPPNGTVHVAARIEPDAVEVTITDAGPGIPEDLRDRIFEPFFSTKEPGVVVRGFGLTMVKSIVDALGGRVTVDDAPGGGAAVRVRIPATEAPD